jgi:hypothetical protein
MFKIYDVIVIKETLKNDDLTFSNTEYDEVKTGSAGSIIDILDIYDIKGISIRYLIEFENNVLAYAKAEQMILYKIKKRQDKLDKI